MTDDEMRFSGQEYGALLDLMMASDPWATTQLDRDRIEEMLNEEALARGYNDWVHAYHDFHGEEVPEDD